MAIARAVIGIAIFFLCGPADAFANRVVFVIGVDQYDHLEPLKKAVGDARAVKAMLEERGGATIAAYLENPTRDEFWKAWDAFWWGALLMEKVMSTTQSRSEKLDIRIAPEAKRMLQEAARARRMTISQFVLDSALVAASEVLAEQSRIVLGAQEWTAFMEALDTPPRRHPRMERLLNEPTSLD
jgi:uncharacterized protein (DUF1778 family)